MNTAREPETLFGWWKLIALWLVTLLVLICVFWGAFVSLGSLTSRINNGNGTRAAQREKADAAKHFYKLCIRRFDAGVMPPECVPNR